MPLNERYPSSFSRIVNYNFLDIILGKGVLELYGADYYASSTKKYILTPKTMYATDGTTQVLASGSLDLDFDIVIEDTLVLEGQCLCQMPVRVANAAGETLTVVAYIRKWNGTSETEVANATTTKVLATANPYPIVMNAVITIPRTVWQAGETLRFSMIGTMPAKNCDWFHDPANRSTINSSDYGVEASQLKIQLPLAKGQE